MPELPRKPGLPLEEKARIDPAAEAPSPRAPHPSSGETDPQGEAAPPTMPAPAASLPPTADEQLPLPPASDDATPMAEVEEPAPAPLPDASEAAAIGAMSAAEAAVRQRAEADYQRAVDDAIRAAQWRTDDAVYVGLVDELVRLRGPGGVESGLPSSAARAAGGFDGASGAAAEMAQRAGARDGYGGAAYGAFGDADASGGGPRPRPRPAVYGSDDERVRAEQVQFAVPLPPPPVGAYPGQGRPSYPYPGQGRPGYYGPSIDLDKLWDSLPELGDLPGVEPPVLMQLLAAILFLLYNKPPHDAKDPNGAKAPGKPGEAEGFKDPKGGEQWVPNPNAKHGGSHGWLDDKGRVWVPTGPKGSRAHGPPHWDVQLPKGKYVNVEPGEHINDAIKKKGL